MTDPEPNKVRSSGSGTERAWAVEARCTSTDPIQVGSQTFGERWKEVKFTPADIGVPAGAPWRKLHEHGLLSYPAAQALRWWVHAQLEAEPLSLGGLCLETRLVSHEIKYTHSITRNGEHALVGEEDRSNIMPDYGVKK